MWSRYACVSSTPGLGDHRASLIGRSDLANALMCPSDLKAEASRLLEHISARWDIEVLFADGKEEFGLDQYQLMSATALVRFWSLALLVYAFLEEERDRLQKQWQRPVTIGEARREIQRLHRRQLLLWLRQQFQQGATNESLFELLAA